jgi:hypothetical protein
MEEDEIEEVFNSSESIAGTELIGGRQQVSISIPNQSDPADGRKISSVDLAVQKGCSTPRRLLGFLSHVKNHGQASQYRIDQHEAA